MVLIPAAGPVIAVVAGLAGILHALQLSGHLLQKLNPVWSLMAR